MPDVLTNAGGVIVSYFEWVQNRQGMSWTLDEVHTRLQKFMQRAFDKVWEISVAENIPLRNAAYALVMRRIGEAVEA